MKKLNLFNKKEVKILTDEQVKHRNNMIFAIQNRIDEAKDLLEVGEVNAASYNVILASKEIDNLIANYL